jgi:hypothetical protein
MEKAEGFSFGFLEFIEFLRITHAAKPKFHHKFRFFNSAAAQSPSPSSASPPSSTSTTSSTASMA